MSDGLGGGVSIYSHESTEHHHDGGSRHGISNKKHLGGSDWDHNLEMQADRGVNNPNCPSGSIAHHMPGFENVCAWKPSTSSTWQRAETLCQNTGGGHLASFANEKELMFVQSLTSFTESFWIGLKKFDTSPGKQSWKFTDSTSPMFAETLWAPGQPDGDGTELCAEMVRWGGTDETNRINNLKCETARPYVCLKVLRDEGDEEEE
jgi:hypothetical protein